MGITLQVCKFLAALEGGTFKRGLNSSSGANRAEGLVARVSSGKNSDATVLAAWW